MDEKPKNGGGWSGYVSLAIGTGLIAYFTRVDREALANSNENWLETIVFLGCLFAVMAALIYVILRAWDGLIGWLRRLRG
jgi:hypothetical protein